MGEFIKMLFLLVITLNKRILTETYVISYNNGPAKKNRDEK